MAEVPLKREGSQPQAGLPSQGVLCWEEEFLWYLVVKISKDSYLPCLVGWLVAGNPEAPLENWHMDLLSYGHLLGLWWRGSSSGRPETCREGLSCVASAWELVEQEPLLSLCGA